MARRNRRIFKTKKDKVIKKNLVRNTLIILILIVFLFVIYRFNFSTKSELVDAIKINFKEYGEDISLENSEIDLEVFTDRNGEKYIILPDQINGYYVNQYYITDNRVQNKVKEENSNVIINTITDEIQNVVENILPENTESQVNDTNEIKSENVMQTEKIAGLRKKFLTSNDLEESEEEKEKSEDNTNTVVENVESTNTVVENTVSTNTIVENEISTNTTVAPENEIIENTVVEENKVNNEVNAENTVEENKIDNETIEKPAYNPDTVVEKVGLKPGSKFTVKETSGEDRYSIGDVSIEVEYQTIKVGDTKLYKQELTFEENETKFIANGYIPTGYSLNAISINKSQEEIQNIEMEIKQSEDFKEFHPVFAYNILFEKDGNVYEPTEFAPSINVKAISTTHLNNVKNELNVKLVRFKNNDIALMSLENEVLDVIEEFKNEDVEFGFDSVEMDTDKFVEYTYVAIAEDIRTEEQIVIDTYESDKNFYLGKNYTDNKDGNNTGKYTEDNLAKVTVNYHSIPENPITGNEDSENFIDYSKINVTSVREPLTGMPANTADCKVTIEVNSDVEVGSNWRMQVTFKDSRYNSNFDIIESSAYKKIDYRTFELSSSAGNQLIDNKIEVLVRVEGSRTTPSNLVLALKPDSVNLVTIENYDYEMSQISASISANENEKQNLVSYKTCLPIIDGKISFELIDNPFMNRPVATKRYSDSLKPGEEVLLGFDGWKNDAYTISINNNTKVQKAEIPVSPENKEITVDLYADWKIANVVFMKQGGTGDGRTLGQELGSWNDAINKLNENPKYASNASDRELNIIIVSGGEINSDNSDNKAFKKADVGYTVTSLYDGHDYRLNENAKVKLTYNVEIENDLQMAFLNITGSGNYNENNSENFKEYNNNGTQKYHWTISGNSYNLRIGRGMTPLNVSDTTTTFAQVQGGSGEKEEYKTVIESGRYSNVYVENGNDSTSKNRNVLANFVLGADYDKALNNNENLNIYYRLTARYEKGIVSTISNSDTIYNICVKSGKIGIDFYEQYGETGSEQNLAGTAGIAIAGYTNGDNTTSSYDKGNRVLTVEGGQIVNITSGLCVNSNYANLANTHIYIKGSGANIQYISAGSFQLNTAGDRILQMTDGIVQYAIAGGINGCASKDGAGTLNGNTLLYIGGNATIGGDDRLVNKKFSPTADKIYDLEYGNVLGAGNGKSGNATAGNLNSSHVIIDGNAKILKNVYGGGNFGKVAQNSKVDILGGTIGGNVYGGSNQNGVDGNVEINMKNGTVDGTVYGGSNVNGTVKGNAKITLSGGTVNANNEGKDAIFVGGCGLGTSVNGTSQIIVNNDSNNVNITGNIYGGSEMGAVDGISAITVNQKSEDRNINIAGNIYGAGKGNNVRPATNKEVSVTIDGGRYENLKVFGGANINGTITGNITVKVGEKAPTYVNEVYAGGNNAQVKCTDNKPYKNEMYLYENAEVGNAYSGGNNAGVEESRTIAMYVKGKARNIYGGSNSAGTVGETLIKCENTENVGNVYGGGFGENTVAKKTTVELLNSIVENVYGGGELGNVDGETSVRISSTTVNGSAFAAGKGDERNACNKALVKGPTKIIAEGTTIIKNNLFGGGDAANVGAIGDTSTDQIAGADSYVYISGATINGSVYGGSNQAKIFGNANLFIGKSAIDQGYEQGKIEISGTIFGGGESRTGSDVFDYNFKSINGNIKINLDGTDYDTTENNSINIKGSIFGSGNASSAAKDGDITIKNYGSRENKIIKKGISVQRATNVVIDNSVMNLEGTTDSTNTYFKDVAYAFNIIGKLTIKNGTMLYLENGANRLSSFYSMVDKDGSEVPAEVTFSEDGITVTKNVDNRIYLYNGSNLNISAREDVQGEYGHVEGMTFFGVYQGENLYSGIYDENYQIGKAPEWGERNFTTSYVLGLHQRDPEHDITKNGFYTTYEILTPEADKLQKENNLTSDQYNSTGSYYGYIEPTPKDYQYYAWYTGLNRLKRIEITADSLIVTNYSTLGAVDVSLKELDAIKKNGTLTIQDFSVNWEDDNITLVDKSEIENISEDANTKFALAMKTGNAGWASDANTNFKYDDGKGSFTGDEQYTFENADTTTTVGLYLYHSKNVEIEENKKLGTGEILMNLTYMEGPNLYTVEVVIHLSMSMQLDKDTGYNAAITPGVKYDLFTTSATDITTDSSFSTFLELSQRNFRDQIINGSKRDDEYYQKLTRVLNTSYMLPEKTNITMVDLSKNNEPKFYYYTVKTPQNIFYLKDFIAMGSKDGDKKELYNETLMNNSYYDSNLKFHYEAFIFIVDFKDVDFPEGENAKITSDPEMTIELHSEQLNDANIPELNIGLISSQLSAHRTKYNVYRANSQNGVSISPRIQNLYVGNTASITVGTSFSTEQVEGATPTNTQYFNKKLGAVVTLTKDGREVQGSELLGTWIEIDGARYHPRSDGTIRVKLNDIVANVSKRLVINATNSSLASGAYKLSIKTFASADGKYYGTEKHLAEDTIDLNIVNNRYGLNSKLPDNQAVIDCSTGLTLNEQGYASRDEETSNTLDVQLEYNSTLTTPYITVALERREYGEKGEITTEKIYNKNYQTVDLADYVELISEDGQVLTKAPKEITNEGRIEYEAVSTENIKSNSSSLGDAVFNLKYKIKPPADGEKLVTGTYRLVFTLYDISQEEREVVINPDTNTSETLPIIPGTNTTTNTSITKPDITHEIVTVYKPIGDVFSYIIIK